VASNDVNERGDLLLGQAGEREAPEDLVAPEVGQCRGQGIGVREIGTAVGADDQ
jgi:hypothetical protein